MKNITWTIEKRKVADLIGADYNPRKMTEQEERDLEESIAEFGTVIPVVINIGKRKDILIGGHQRTRLYTKKGIEEVDVMIPSRELTLAEEKRLNLRLNKNVGSWDQEKLREMGLDLLLDVGFGDEDLQVFFDDVDVIDDSFNTGRAIKDIKNPKAKNGDIYQLGEHRLMCGDATNIEQVHALMGKNHADMIFNDPPLTLKNEGHVLPPSKEKKELGDFAAFIDKSDDGKNSLIKKPRSNNKRSMNKLHYPTTYLVWDLETSGLEKESCKILEIGCATVHDGQIVERKSWVLNHGIEIPANITEITGITNELIAAEGKDPKQAMTEFLDILLSNQEGAHLTHNGIRFDIEWFAKGVKYNVAICCEELGVDRTGITQHRALGDCELTHEIYKKLLAI